MRLFVFFGAFAVLGAGCTQSVATIGTPAGLPAPVPEVTTLPPVVTPTPPLPVPSLTAPIDRALGRVTKKTFGLKVSPKDSPVSPERFSGYHTGVDFETTPDEQQADVPINAACDGTLALKEFASGYGGVAVERCKQGGDDVTVIYGHLRLSSITAKAGQALKTGDRLGLLGTGYSKETDGERKHLHFGIHKGTSINIKGYVQSEAELAGWIDALTLWRQ